MSNPVQKITTGVRDVTGVVMSPAALKNTLTATNVLVAMMVFIALSPGMLLNVSRKDPVARNGVMNTSHSDVLLHGLAFALVMFLLTAVRIKGNAVSTPAMVTVSAILFMVLSPGFLLQLPPAQDGQWWMTNRTNMSAVFVHALVFGVLFGVVRRRN